jgi:hypothetical protein
VLQFGDGGRRQSRREQAADVLNGNDVGLGVLAIAVAAAARLQQALPLVVAQQAGVDPAPARELADPHA